MKNFPLINMRCFIIKECATVRYGREGRINELRIPDVTEKLFEIHQNGVFVGEKWLFSLEKALLGNVAFSLTRGIVTAFCVKIYEKWSIIYALSSLKKCVFLLKISYVSGGIFGFSNCKFFVNKAYFSNICHYFSCPHHPTVYALPDARIYWAQKHRFSPRREQRSFKVIAP